MSAKVIEMERALISAVMTFGSEPAAWMQVAQVDPRDFLDPRHEIVWARLSAWRDRELSAGRDFAIDPFVFSEELTREGLIDKAGGKGYVLADLTTVPENLLATSVGTLARQVQEGAQRRRLIHLLPSLASRLGDKTEYAHGEIMAEIRRAVEEATEVTTGDRWKWISEYSQQIWDLVDRGPQTMDDGSKVVQIPTGIKSLDRALGGGITTTDLVCVAARSSVGKSAFVLNVLTSISQRGVPVGIISLETTAAQLGLRALSSLSRVDVKDLLYRINRPGGNPEGSFEDEWRRLARGAEELHGLPIMFVDEGYPTVEELISLIYSAYHKHGVRVFAIDYVQKIRPSAHTLRYNKADQVGHITSALKAAAKTLGVFIFLIAQINRGVEGRQNKRPTMSDLRDSGRIEEDVDGIWFLYREGYYQQQGVSFEQAQNIPEHIRRHAEVNIAKGRNDGSAGKVLEFTWFGEYQKFEDPAQGWE